MIKRQALSVRTGKITLVSCYFMKNRKSRALEKKIERFIINKFHGMNYQTN